MTIIRRCAEQVVRLSLEGMEVAAKITGSAAKEVAALLYAALKNRDKNKIKGRQRLTSMLKSGKELTIFSVKNSDMKRFVADAKRYGVCTAHSAIPETIRAASAKSWYGPKVQQKLTALWRISRLPRWKTPRPFATRWKRESGGCRTDSPGTRPPPKRGRYSAGRYDGQACTENGGVPVKPSPRQRWRNPVRPSLPQIPKADPRRVQLKPIVPQSVRSCRDIRAQQQEAEKSGRVERAESKLDAYAKNPQNEHAKKQRPQKKKKKDKGEMSRGQL